MASNNYQNNNNQPRRKRNKKPVKRYSEEYNNRPNPYTGYSSDGNYHPEAKKRPISEASAANSAKRKAGQGTASRYDYNRAAMTDAVWPPANTQTQQPAAKPVPTTAGQFAESTSPTDSFQKSAQKSEKAAKSSSAVPVSADIADLAETAAKLENEGSEQGAKNTQHTQSAGNAKNAENPPHRKGGSHRKKNGGGKQQSEQARKAKLEAKKAAVDKIAQGVAAHSVSEQMIDDIANMSEAMESRSKEQKTQKTETTETARQGGGVNWDELYDAAFPPKAQEVEEQEKTESKGKKKAKPKKQRREFDEVSAQSQPMPVKPVMLGEDDALPYDLIVEENAREAEEAKAAEIAKAKAAKEAERRRREADAFQNPPLEPSDLIPVLGFDKPETPVPDPVEAVEEVLDAGEDIIDVAGEVSLEEIIGAAEQAAQEKRDAAIQAEAAAVAASAALTSEFVFGGMDFDTEQSEGWHALTPPAADEILQAAADETADQPAEDGASLLSQRLLESYMELEDQPLEYIPEDTPDEAEVESELVETVDLNDFYEPAGSPMPVEVEVETEDIAAESYEPHEPHEPHETDEPAAGEAEAEEAVSVVDIDISEIEDEIFAETDISGVEEENLVEVGEEVPASGEEAVKEKLEKLVEAAELAEVLRQESEDAAPEGEQANEEIDIFSVSLPSEPLPEATGDAEGVAVVPEEEVIREYHPRKSPKLVKDENVFESVLIVDDSRSVVDDEAAGKQDDMQFLHAAAVSENPTAVFRLPDGPLVLPADVDDADFQEHWLDDDEDGDEMATRSKRARRRVSAFIGGVVILFMVMVVVSVMSTVITGFSNIGSTNEKKVEYSEFITPVVLNDPAPFETIDKADNQMLLESAIWRVLEEISAAEDYEYTYDATRKIVISADDVAKAGRELFGDEVQLYMNVLNESDGSAIYYYDSIDNSFHISTGSLLGPAPVITKMAQKSDYISLVVGYVNQEEMSLTSSDEDDVECYKYMEYVLALRSDDSYYIQSIRDYVEE